MVSVASVDAMNVCFTGLEEESERARWSIERHAELSQEDLDVSELNADSIAFVNLVDLS